MNYGEIKQLVKKNLGGRQDSDIDALVEKWVNNCYLDLITRGRFPEIKRMQPISIPELDGERTFSTTGGDDSYAMASDALFPVALRDTTNNQILRQRGIRWIERNKATTDSKPLYYGTYAGEYILEPTPDDVYVINDKYRKIVDIPTLTADEDTPVIHEIWHEALELGATWRGAKALGYPEASRWFGDLKNFIIGHSEQGSEEDEDADYGVTVIM